jgi:hypothetical protein
LRVADDHGLVEHSAVELDDVAAAALGEIADVAFLGPLDDVHDLADVRRLALAARADVDHLGADAVAGERAAGVALGHEEVAVLGGRIGHEEPEAALVEAEHAGHVAPRRREPDGRGVGPEQVAGIDEPLHALAERLLLVLGHAKVGGEVVRLARPIALVGDVLEDALGVAIGQAWPGVGRFGVGRVAALHGSPQLRVVRRMIVERTHHGEEKRFYRREHRGRGEKREAEAI